MFGLNLDEKVDSILRLKKSVWKKWKLEKWKIISHEKKACHLPEE